MKATRIQARIPLPPALVAAFDPIRRRWSPLHARGNPAHVTLAYQDEAPDPHLLRERLRHEAVRTACFVLAVGRVRRFALPAAGAYLEVADPGGHVSGFRARLLAPPFAPRERYAPHVTLVHPAESERLEEAWPELRAIAAHGRFVVDHLELVDTANTVIGRFPLATSVRLVVA